MRSTACRCKPWRACSKTIDQVIEIAPDRIALFGYAHVPWLKTHQRMIKDEDLPDIARALCPGPHGRRA